MVKLRDEVDKLAGLKRRFGELPPYIGFDPFRAWILHCSSCNTKRNLFDDEINRLDRGKLKRRENPGFRCKACGDTPKVRQKMDYARSYHLNLIRRRSTTMDETKFNPFTDGRHKKKISD